MTPSKFIIEKLNKISKEYTSTTFRYVYDYNYDQHIIEVTPKEDYSASKFIEKQLELENEFIQKFPELDILFITEDHGLSLPEFIYEINRNEYAAYELFDKDWWGTYLIDSTDLAPIAEFWNDSWSDLTWDDFDLGEFEPLKWDDFELDDSLVEVHELEVPVRTIIYSDNEGTGFMAIAA